MMDVLVENLQYWRNVTKEGWGRSDFVNEEDFGSGIANFSIVTMAGDTTVIPPFWMYEHSWNRSGLKSPFKFNWCLFDRTRADDMKYLLSVIQVLREQADVWGVDRISKESFVYFNFKGYVRSLIRFYAFLTIGEEVVAGIMPAV